MADSTEKDVMLLNVAGSAAQMCATLALEMHRQGLLTPRVREGLALHLRGLGEVFEWGQDDEIAAQFATAANLLRQPPPQAQE